MPRHHSDREAGTFEDAPGGCDFRADVVLALLGRARDWPLAMKHAAGWQGDEHAELSTQTNQAVVYVSRRIHTLSLSLHVLRSRALAYLFNCTGPTTIMGWLHRPRNARFGRRGEELIVRTVAAVAAGPADCGVLLLHPFPRDYR